MNPNSSWHLLGASGYPAVKNRRIESLDEVTANGFISHCHLELLKNSGQGVWHQ